MTILDSILDTDPEDEENKVQVSLYEADTKKFVKGLAWGHSVSNVEKREDGTTIVCMVHVEYPEGHPITLEFNAEGRLMRLQYRDYVKSPPEVDLSHVPGTRTYKDAVTGRVFMVEFTFYEPTDEWA